LRLATDLSAEPVDVMSLINCESTTRNGRLTVINGGGECCIVGGHFAFSGDHARILLDVLPPIAHIRKEQDKEAMRWALERMREELSEPRPGGFLVAQHLAHMMLVQALRLYLADGPQGGVGWLFALADTQISAAIQAMHSRPSQHWKLEDLAVEAGMSRSVFAQRFKATVGQSPMDYFARWRMLVASDRLANTRDSISEVALSLGYESESAFGTAFKRVMGCSPRQYARGCPPAPRLRSSQLAIAESEAVAR
jgi:AraC-like DNA-binding protein